jgi:oxidase EvaA
MSPDLFNKVTKEEKKSNFESAGLFLKSASIKISNDRDSTFVLKWLKEQNEKVSVNVDLISFEEMKQWHFDLNIGSLRHVTGRFFSIDGIRVNTNWGSISSWDQPIINQPEIGYLGFIAKEFNGILHLLVQAKIEPGNVNHVQLSPTIQATRSNYNQVHKGNKPLYLEYFQNVSYENVLLDQLQSEQGSRFLSKRNRNIIIRIQDDIPVHDNFIWLTIGHIKEMMRYDNLVNMDTRTVISGLHYGEFSEANTLLLQYFMGTSNKDSLNGELFKSAVTCEGNVNTIGDIIHFITDIKSKYDLFVNRISLFDVKEWIVSDFEIFRADQKYFKVIGVNVSISNREVLSWQQPMIQPSHTGICAFICKKINGNIHFIVQAKLECGNRDIIEMAPTVQCLTGDYRSPDNLPIPFLNYVLNASNEMVVMDTFQSEEGGRFYKEQNRNLIIMADDNLFDQLPEHYIWMTLNQLYFFNRFNNYLNIQARSLIAAISFI